MIKFYVFVFTLPCFSKKRIRRVTMRLKTHTNFYTGTYTHKQTTSNSVETADVVLVDKIDNIKLQIFESEF